MTEEKFARWILVEFKEDPILMTWYEKTLTGRPLTDTIESILSGLELGQITRRQAILLAIFIGLSTERKMADKKDPRP